MHRALLQLAANTFPSLLPLMRRRRFGTIINAWDLESLDEQLRCLEPLVPMMRHAMRDVWQRMLYSTAYARSLLGEDRQHDVLHTIMQVCLRLFALRAQEQPKPLHAYRGDAALSLCLPEIADPGATQAARLQGATRRDGPHAATGKPLPVHLAAPGAALLRSVRAAAQLDGAGRPGHRMHTVH